MKRLIAAAAFAFVLAAPIGASAATTPDQWAQLVPPRMVHTFCTAYAHYGDAIFPFFRVRYHHTARHFQAAPTAHEMFDALVLRCP